MIDRERVDDFLALIADKYTAVEVVEILELDVWDVLEMFREELLEKQERFEI